MIDSRDIKLLHSTVSRAANELIQRMKYKGFDILITSTYRDFEAQNALFAKGRTKPGKIVTNARGGESIHNYALAFDICQNKKGFEYQNKALFEQAGHEWVKMGGEWGGNWKPFVDRVHFQYTGGLTIKQLKQGETLPKQATMPWEKSITEVVEKYVPKNIQVLFQKQTVQMSSILFQEENYIRLRDLEKLGFMVCFDNQKKCPMIKEKG